MVPPVGVRILFPEPFLIGVMVARDALDIEDSVRIPDEERKQYGGEAQSGVGAYLIHRRPGVQISPPLRC